MSDKEGPYWALANAQRLSLGTDLAGSSSDLDEEVFENISMDANAFRDLNNQHSKSKEHLGSFGLFLWEQKFQWKWYSLMILGTLGAGGEFGSMLFAQVSW
jgi:ATP-binding cassette subfamily B (MDR/TAP) protein 1